MQAIALHCMHTVNKYASNFRIDRSNIVLVISR